MIFIIGIVYLSNTRKVENEEPSIEYKNCDKEIKATCTKIKGLESTWEGLCIGEKVFLQITEECSIQVGDEAIFYINPNNRKQYKLKEILN